MIRCQLCDGQLPPYHGTGRRRKNCEVCRPPTRTGCPVWIAACLECRNLFVQPGRGRHRKWCLTCMPDGTSAEKAAKWRELRAASVRQRNIHRRSEYVSLLTLDRDKLCRQCEQSFTVPAGESRQLCPPCRELNKAERNRRHAARNHERRTLQKRDKRRILERDNWTCYLCGRGIPQDKKWPHPLYPSVDHVIPVSAGGSDHPDNLRATHWHCNEEKGDSLLGVEFGGPLAA